MIKVILAFIIGAGVSGATCFFIATDKADKKYNLIIKNEQETLNKQINECKDQVSKSEEELKTVSEELKLNETRSCFVTGKTLEAPEFSPPDLEPLSNNKNGDIILNWTPVKGAKQYVVTVEDNEGQIISTVDVEGETSIYLNRMTHASKLSEAEYYVRIASVNGLDQTGTPGPKKPIRFSSQSFKVAKHIKKSKINSRK